MSTILEALKKAQKESDKRLEEAIVRTERGGPRWGLIAGLVVVGLALGLWAGYLVSVFPPAGEGGKEAPEEEPVVRPERALASVPADEGVAAEVPEAAPAAAVASGVPEAPTGEIAEETGEPALEVSGVVYDPVSPMAIINGRFVGVGDFVAGAEVLKIERDSVRLRLEDGDRTLILKQ